MKNINAIQSRVVNIMRWSLLHFCIGVIFANFSIAADVTAQELLNRKISVQATNEKVQTILSEIEAGASVKFSYSPNLIRASRRTTLNVTGETLAMVLDKLLTPINLRYEVVGKQIILKRNLAEEPAPVTTPAPDQSSLLPADVKVNGTVTDEKGGSLPGVSVLLKGTGKGTTTDINGKYDLVVPSRDGILVFSFVGFDPKEVSIGSGSVINVTLKESSKALEEVVVIAYGSQKKSSLTSAVSTIDGKKITDVPSINVANAIGGRAPGVLFKQSSGQPGYDEATIRIRGVGTVGNANALTIVDGVERPLSSVDPHDIQSMSVLKDAASVAPYGVRGANGIILITTKRGSGSDGKFAITYDGKAGWTRPVTLPDELNSFDWATLKNEGARNEGILEPYDAAALQKFKDGSDPDFYANENGIKRLLKTGKLQQHNLSVAGGNEKISFYGSLGYVDQTAMWGDVTRFKRYTIRSNIDAKLTENTKVGLDFTSIFRDANYPGVSGNARSSPGTILFGLWRLNPTNPIFYQDGKPAGYFERNPYQDLYESGYIKEDFYSQFVTIRVEQKIPFVPGLTLKANVSIDKQDTLSKQWRTPYTFYQINPDRSYISGKGNVPKPSLTESYVFARRITAQAMATYNKSFGRHNIDVLGVFEPRVDKMKALAAGRTNYELLIDELSNSGNNNPSDLANGGGSSKVTQVGYVYRVAYDYYSKYFVEAAGRYDGQSYFSPASKYAFFPSFSAAWRVSEEPFLQQVNAIDNMKIRGSWGKVGNLADRSFQYFRLYNLGPTYLFNNAANASLYEVREPSPNITWEKATKIDVGLELNLWKGHLALEADYFYEKRNDMLIASTAVLPNEYGIAVGQENTGVMQNSGFDFKLSSNHTISRDWSIGGVFNFTYAKNKIININEAESIRNNPNRTEVGKPLGTPFGYEVLGLFQSQEEINQTPYAKALGSVKPGDVKYLDLNSDGKLDNDDIKPIGNANFPQIIYGLEGVVKYKNFQLDMLWQGAAKVNYYLSGWASLPFNQANGVAFKHHQDVWRPDNTDAEFPRILTNPGNYAYNNYTSSFWVRNGDYLRLKSLSASYTFTNLGKAVKAIKIYVAGQNLWTLTKTKYWDPESPNTTDYYYQERAISIGTTFNF